MEYDDNPIRFIAQTVGSVIPPSHVISESLSHNENMMNDDGQFLYSLYVGCIFHC